MPSCLGLYIENNMIKYAKITKEHDNFRIDSFGMKFFDNINEAIKQIISETYSYKTPIATNISDEKYYYAQVFSLLNSKYLEKAVSTEFELYCNETGKNRKALEYRNLLVPNLEDKDKYISLYAYADKSNIVGKLQLLDSYRVSKIVPLPLSIVNLSTFADRKNSIIVNIEKNTSVTTIINGEIYKVDIIENGMKEILDSIMIKENSYAKAYEICKNTTIYTTQGRNLQVEENEYMEDIMPVLYKIIEKLQEIIIDNGIEISNIYITGLAAVINNIDLYFEENFPDKKCEILTPFFIKKTNVKLNIKDYIEVNSAISLALQGIGIGKKEINFKKNNNLEAFSSLLKTEKTDKKGNGNKNSSIQKNAGNLKNGIKFNMSGALDRVETSMMRTVVMLVMLAVIYIAFSKIITSQINKTEDDVQDYISYTQEQISSITTNIRTVKSRTEQYNSLIEKIQEATEKLTQSYARKNVLPNFLTEIMFNIPKEVQILSIKNPSGKVIKIEAQAEQYEQLGYFIAKIKNEGILTDVTASSGTKKDEVIKITIQGNLPY